MKTTKTYDEIQQKICRGEAVILTADEVKEMSKECSPAEIARKVDVVTTATFGPMCSSGAFINFGHTDPPIRMEQITLNDVPAYGGIAAVDAYLGATETNPDNPEYGGAHVIHDLISGKNVTLKARGKGTDCYPRREVRTIINKETINEFYLFNPRNAYQNYPAATNSTQSIKYTYMGILLPDFGNITYSTSGELSPLLNDPDLRTIGIGTKIFLCGADGFIAWNGTQFSTTKERNYSGIPVTNAASLAVIGNLKEMSADFIKPAIFEKYGVSIFIGIGVPIPIIDEDIARKVTVRNSEINAAICDYGINGHPEIVRTNYEQLQSGQVEIKGKQVKTSSLSSIYKAKEINRILKEKIISGKFTISQPVQNLPEGSFVKRLQIKETEEK